MPQNTKSFWDSIYHNGKDYRLISTNSLNRIIEAVDIHEGRALDIGCGTGQLSRELYHRGFSVTGVDISSEALQSARSASKYIEYIEMDFESDSLDQLGSTKFDLIPCKLVFAFIKNPDNFIERVKAMLANNGAFIIITPTYEQVDEEKQNIAVDHANTLELLEKTFTSVNHFELDGLTVYTAQL